MRREIWEVFSRWRVTTFCYPSHFNWKLNSDISQSMGKGEFWPTMTSKSLKIFKFELDVHDNYVREFYTHANFHFNPFRQLNFGFSVLRFCDFFPGYRYTVFFSGTRPGRTVDGFSPFMDRTTWFHPRMPPFWKSKMRRNSAEDRSSDLHQILHVDVEISANLNFWQKLRKFENPRWRTVENRQ